MSVEGSYRPCPPCIEGDHTSCNEESNCWCVLCWVIVPTKTATPDKQERGYKTKPTNLRMLPTKIESVAMPIAVQWAHDHNAKYGDHVIHEWQEGVPSYCETCGEGPFTTNVGSSESVTYGPYDGERNH